ncbi:MAG: hypothetical protein WC393_02850 [Candidatus Nanoarchaeia archaeon]|jgi:hypothetical protein
MEKFENILFGLTLLLIIIGSFLMIEPLYFIKLDPIDYYKIRVTCGSAILSFGAGALWFIFKIISENNKETQKQENLINSLKTKTKIILKQITDIETKFDGNKLPIWKINLINSEFYLININNKYKKKSTEILKEILNKIDQRIEMTNNLVSSIIYGTSKNIIPNAHTKDNYNNIISEIKVYLLIISRILNEMLP